MSEHVSIEKLSLNYPQYPFLSGALKLFWSGKYHLIAESKWLIYKFVVILVGEKIIILYPETNSTAKAHITLNISIVISLHFSLLKILQNSQNEMTLVRLCKCAG